MVGCVMNFTWLGAGTGATMVFEKLGEVLLQLLKTLMKFKSYTSTLLKRTESQDLSKIASPGPIRGTPWER